MLSSSRRETATGGPLQGVRIVEMGQLIAIPFAMKLLADMGAQVIRLESTRRLESSGTEAQTSTSRTGTSWVSPSTWDDLRGWTSCKG